MSKSLERFVDGSGIVLVLFVLAAISIALLANGLQLGTYQDDGGYITLARSMVFHGRYADANDPALPSINLWPFGFPLILAPVAAIAGNRLWMFQCVNVIMALLVLWAVYVYLSRVMHRRLVLTAVALLACSPSFASTAAMVMSETSFLLFVMLAMLLHQSDAMMKPRGTTDAKIVLVTVYSYFVRSAGIACVIASAVETLLRRNYKRFAILAIVFALCAGLWCYRGLNVTGTAIGSNYASDFGHSDRSTIPAHLGAYLSEIIPGEMVSLSVHPRLVSAFARVHLDWLRVAFNSLLSVLILYGIVRASRDRSRRFELLFVAFSFALLLPYYFANERYVYPILPLLYAYFVDAGYALAARLLARPRALCTAVLVCLLAGSMAHVVALSHNPSRNRIRDISVGAAWFHKNTPPDSLVMAFAPRSIWLYIRRPTIDLAPAKKLDTVVRKRRVSYVLIGPELDKPDVAPAIPPVLNDPRKYKLVFEDRPHMTYIFKTL